MASPLSFLLIGLLLAPCESLVSDEELKEISQNGRKYISEAVENAKNEVKTMKKVIDKTGKERVDMLVKIDETKTKKQEALTQAQEAKQQLDESTEVCNPTMLTLWEKCKPCMKQTCITFYSKTCSSGAGLVGRQFEEYLSHASPLTIWINGEKIDSLEAKDENQRQKLEDLEEGYSMVKVNVNVILLNSASIFDGGPPVIPSDPIADSVWNFPGQPDQPSRSSDFFAQISGSSFNNLFEHTLEMMERTRRLMQQDSSDAVEEKGTGTDNQMVCSELRRNSAGCLKMKDKCDKCKEILSVDCSGKQSAQSLLKQQYEQAVRLAEKLSSQHEKLLQRYQEKMLDTTSQLDNLNKQYGWVSHLSNLTENSDEMYQVTMVMSKSSDDAGPAYTIVTVKLLNSDPITFTLPGEVSSNDPAFSETVAKEALRQYKKKKGDVLLQA